MPVRTATAEDLPTLVELMTCFYKESSFAPPGEPAKKAFAQLLDDPALGRIWVCEEQNEAAGYIVLTFGFSMEYGGRDAFVDDLYVRAEYRGRGLGKRLLDVLIAECEPLQVRALHLEVGHKNHRARTLYRSRGFRDSDRRLLTLKLTAAIHETDRRAATDSSNPAQTQRLTAPEKGRG